jgi:hypothetical protein
MATKKKMGTQAEEVKANVSLLKKEARLLSKSVKKRGPGSVSLNTLSLIGELVASIRIDRNASKFSQAVIKEEVPIWPFPNHGL